MDLSAELTSRKAEAKYVPEQRGDMRHTPADFRKAAGVLNYRPQAGIRVGLKDQTQRVKSALQV